MRLHAVAALCLWSVLTRAQATLADQPLIFSNDTVRVFALDLPAGGSIKLGPGQHNSFLVTLQDGVLSSARPGEAPVINVSLPPGDGRVLYGGTALTIVNRGGTYHGVLVEFLNPAVSSYGYQWQTGDWDWGASSFSPPVAERATFVNALPLNQAIAWQVQLVPGDALPAANQGPAWLMIAVTDLELRGEKVLRLPAGEVRWFPAGPRPKLVNTGGAVARFVVLNFGRYIDMPSVIPIIK